MSLLYDPDVAVATLAEADPEMGQLIERAGPFALEIRELLDPFQSLVRAIVSQQLSGKAAATIYGRVLDCFDGAAPTPASLLETEDETLRAAGLSRAKTAAVKDLAAKTLEGVVPDLATLREMENDEIIARITAVRGIGPWTVEMLLIFRLGRPDVLPVTDLGVRKGFMLTYGLDDLPKPTALVRHGERWRPYRSVASWYLWRAVDTLTPA